MDQGNLVEKIDLAYKLLEKRTGLSKQEIEYKSLLYLQWTLNKAEDGYRIVAWRKDNGSTSVVRPNLDILEKIYQQHDTANSVVKSSEFAS